MPKPDAEIGDRLMKISAALSFMKDVTFECHAGHVQLDAVGLSAVFGLIEAEASLALTRHQELEFPETAVRGLGGNVHSIQPRGQGQHRPE